MSALAGLASPARMRRHCGWAFLVVAVVLAAKIYGAPVVSILGHLPGASETLWPSWGTPEVALPVALLAGIGVESVSSHGVDLRIFAGLLGAGLLTVGYFAVRDHSQLLIGTSGIGVGGWGFAALAATVVVVLVAWARPRAAGVLIVVMITVELVALAPRGFYSSRHNPYPQEAWITKLVSLAKSPGNARIFSTDGLLFTDTASVYGLADLRVIDAIYVARYFTYFQTFVSPATYDRWMATGPTEGFPSIFNNPMFDLMGARFLPQKRPFSHPDPNYHVIAKIDGVLIYENAAAFPRAFVVHQVHVVPNESASLAYLKTGGTRDSFGALRPLLDPRTQAVVESDDRGAIAPDPACSTTGADSATITRYEPSRIDIRVKSGCAGLVVLSDTYFPGWTATVNGHSSTVYPTDVAFRGIVVPAGTSTVVLRYQPRSFRDGLALALVAVLGFVAVALFLLWRRREAHKTSAVARLQQ